MKSSDLLEISTWVRWSGLIIRNAPSAPGVYVFRMSGGQALPKLKDKSDILYIGATTGSLRKRLAQHCIIREDGVGAGYRLDRVVKEVGPVEVGWLPCPDRRMTKCLESELLSKYEHDHIELPPLNRQESGIRVRAAIRLIQLLPDDKRQEVLTKYFNQTTHRNN